MSLWQKIKNLFKKIFKKEQAILNTPEVIAEVETVSDQITDAVTQTKSTAKKPRTKKNLQNLH
jgi:hypothetical protein